MLGFPRIPGPVAAALISSALAGACLAVGEMPQRIVDGNTVVSARDPSARIELPGSATYVGSERWILEAYSDDIELHVFVDADPARRVKRIYWVQFEAYLPSRPELKHTYDSARRMTLGGMDFLVDTWAERTGRSEDPESDGAHLKARLRSAGYTLPESLQSVRFVHLMDGARKELMLIYSEDAAPRALQPELLRRAQLSFRFH